MTRSYIRIACSILSTAASATAFVAAIASSSRAIWSSVVASRYLRDSRNLACALLTPSVLCSNDGKLSSGLADFVMYLYI